MKGEPLSHTILNVVVGTVVRHWVAVMVEQLGRQDKRGREGWKKRPLLSRWWHVSVIRPRIDEGGFRHPVRAVQLGGPEEYCWEDIQDGLLSLSGGRQPVGGGVRAADDRRGTIITGEAASQSAVFRVWGEMVLGLLAVHQQTQHGKESVGRCHWNTTDPLREPQS